MINTLVLGGNGFIGSHLVDRLIAEGHRVRIFDLAEDVYRKPLANVEYFYGDIENKLLINKALEEVNLVFHLISTTIPKTSNENPVYDVVSNIVGTIRLLEMSIEHHISKFIYISSGGTVYGIPGSLPVSEESPTNPRCSYGITKLTVEKYLGLFNFLYGMDYVIVRPSNAYGARQNPFGLQGAISAFLSKVAKGMPVEVWGDGKIVRDFIYVEDLVDGIYKAAILKSPSRIYNLGSGVGHSLNNIVEVINKVIGREIRVEHLEGRPLDIPEIYLDISRATTDLAWRPITPLDVGIKRTWAFVRRIVGGKLDGPI